MPFDIHPLRQRLNDEFHARPPIPLTAPVLVSHLAFVHDGGAIALEKAHLARLCSPEAWQAVDRSGSHVLLDNGTFEVRWELHTEFSSYTFFRPLAEGESGDAEVCALDAVPADWLAEIPGQLIVGTHINVLPDAVKSAESIAAALAPEGRQMVVSQVVDGAAWIFTDLQLDDRFSRFLVIDKGLTRRQVGRTVQRLWEIETYRMVAMLGLPVAKEVGRWLRASEARLADMMDWIGAAKTSDDERAVLGEMSTLAAEVEHSVARTAFRFGASRAYHSLVMQRIDELRETRVKGFPTLKEFMERRLLPPMNTCQAMDRRQEELSGRVARNSQLLRTRVDIELERQNQELLHQMNRRAKLQLRLQETVEGLSVVAITYYGSQIVHYLAKAASKFWPAVSPELATGVAIPLIAVLVALGLRRMRKKLAAEEDAAG
jgi:uncharacterized membrane-anchored protein